MAYIDRLAVVVDERVYEFCESPIAISQSAACDQCAFESTTDWHGVSTCAPLHSCISLSRELNMKAVYFWKEL